MSPTSAFDNGSSAAVVDELLRDGLIEEWTDVGGDELQTVLHQPQKRQAIFFAMPGG